MKTPPKSPNRWTLTVQKRERVIGESKQAVHRYHFTGPLAECLKRAVLYPRHTIRPTR